MREYGIRTATHKTSLRKMKVILFLLHNIIHPVLIFNRWSNDDQLFQQ